MSGRGMPRPLPLALGADPDLLRDDGHRRD